MEKLTKEERNRVYRKALEMFENGYDDGICIAFGEVIFGKTYNYSDGQLDINCFPEFLDHKPVDAKYYWFGWGSSGIEKRIEVLNECIKATE